MLFRCVSTLVRRERANIAALRPLLKIAVCVLQSAPPQSVRLLAFCPILAVSGVFRFLHRLFAVKSVICQQIAFGGFSMALRSINLHFRKRLQISECVDSCRSDAFCNLQSAGRLQNTTRGSWLLEAVFCNLHFVDRLHTILSSRILDKTQPEFWCEGRTRILLCEGQRILHHFRQFEICNLSTRVSEICLAYLPQSAIC